jgi:hypothetical protein
VLRTIFFTDIFSKKAAFPEIAVANGQIPVPLRAENRRSAQHFADAGVSTQKSGGRKPTAHS